MHYALLLLAILTPLTTTIAAELRSDSFAISSSTIQATQLGVSENFRLELGSPVALGPVTLGDAYRVEWLNITRYAVQLRITSIQLVGDHLRLTWAAPDCAVRLQQKVDIQSEWTDSSLEPVANQLELPISSQSGFFRLIAR